MHDLTTVFEDEGIRVETSLIESDTLVFSFNSYSGDGTDGTRAGYRFLTAQRFAAIYITARESHWWQVADQRSFIEAILPLAARYERRVTYGSSMGGYGALMYAKDLQATGVVSLVPQTIIGDPRYKMKPVWAESIARYKLVRDDIAETIGDVPNVRLLYDPRHAMDRAFIDYLAPFAPHAEHYTFPFVGHKVPNFIAEIGIISATMRGILRGELTPLQVRKMVRPLRRNGPQYMTVMTRRCERRAKATRHAVPG